MFSAFNPSKCTHLEQWAADCAAPGEQSWTSCRAGIRTHNLGLPRVSSPTLYPSGQRLPNTELDDDVMPTVRLGQTIQWTVALELLDRWVAKSSALP